MKDADLVVMELSSFQLELMSAGPQIAAVLNFTPDHLDRHHTLQAYAEAKQRILENQDGGGWAVLGHDDPQVWSWRDLVRGRLASFGASDIGLENSAFLHEGALTLRSDGRLKRICAAEEVRLRGQHNLLNILAACMLGALAGVDAWAMEQVARTFEGVPHRLEFVRKVNGASWFNDSIATTPQRALAAVRAFDEPIILLLGGRDKDLPWKDFLEQAIPRIERLVLFGEAGSRIEAVARDVDKEVLLERSSGLEQAVRLAARAARPGMVILLSPGCTSFDEFSDYEERGERFRQWVRSL
jgi:UDP-N-acetylmuramoylalanine--D-glutamate ligase